MKTPNFTEYIEVRGECHVYTGHIDKRTGYGFCSYLGKHMTTHRAAYLYYKGSIPSNLCVLHTCHIRSCINPNHLRLGTRSENNQERWDLEKEVKMFRLLGLK